MYCFSCFLLVLQSVVSFIFLTVKVLLRITQLPVMVSMSRCFSSHMQM
jgi:hypothetical protein